MARLLLNILIALAGLLIVGLAAWMIIRRAGDPDQPPAAPVNVATVRVVLTDIIDELAVPGRIEPRRVVTVSAEQAGKIIAQPADKGERVAAGAVLLSQDRELLELAEQRAALALDEAERELRRRRELQTAGALALSELESLQTRRDLAAVALQEARQRLARGEILSPLPGLIEHRYMETGEYAREGDALFRIIDLETVKVSCFVPERDRPGIVPGQKAAFTVDALPAHVFSGRVDFVAAAADAGRNTFLMEIAAANPGGILKPGMIARVRMQKGMRENAVVVPLSAVVARKGEHLVYVVEDGHARSLGVVLDMLSGTNAVLAAGLDAGQELVVEGQRALIDGGPVKVVEIWE